MFLSALASSVATVCERALAPSCTKRLLVLDDDDKKKPPMWKQTEHFCHSGISGEKNVSSFVNYSRLWKLSSDVGIKSDSCAKLAASVVYLAEQC